MNTIRILILMCLPVLLFSCRSVERQPAANGDAPAYTGDLITLIPAGEPAKGKAVTVAMNEIDVGKCAMSVKPGKSLGEFGCTLMAEWAKPGQKIVAALESPSSAQFKVFEQGGKSITVHFLVDRIEVVVKAVNEMEAGRLVSDELRANMHKLRMVRYVIVSP